MKLHVVCSVFACFALSLSVSAQTVLSDPEHRAKYDAALKDAARYKAEQQYYDNWVSLQWFKPTAIALKTAADWTFDYETKIGTFIADKYDEYTVPKFANDAAGYEAERQYYERRVKALEPFEAPVKVIKASADLAGAVIDPAEAAVGWTYLTVTDPKLGENTKAAWGEVKKVASDMTVVSGGPQQESTTANSTTVQIGQTVFGSGGTNGVFSSTNNATQVWASPNTGAWQCVPVPWNSQNKEVVDWRKK